MSRSPVHPDEYGGQDLNSDDKLRAGGWAAGLDVWEVVDDALGEAVADGTLANAQLWSLRRAVRRELIEELMAVSALPDTDSEAMLGLADG